MYRSCKPAQTAPLEPWNGKKLDLHSRGIGVHSNPRYSFPARPSIQGAIQPNTILVVEDNPGVRGFLVNILSQNGYNVIDAEAAAGGLKLFEAHRLSICLVIVDMVMPGMSGLDLAVEFLVRCPLLQILYMSGYSDSVAIQGLLQHSTEVVLLKPFTESVLLERVRCLVRSKSKTD